MSDQGETTGQQSAKAESHSRAARGIRRPGRVWWNWFRGRKLRTQLLLTVNFVVGTSLVAFLSADYLHSVRTAIRTKAASLADEARAISVAIEPLQRLGPGAIQNHIDAVCTTMIRRESPGHLIQVRIGQEILQSHPALHGEPESGTAIEAEARVLGRADYGGVEVTVSERREGAVRDVEREAALRAGIIAATAALGALIINVLILRLVDAPVRRLTKYVREVTRGTFGQPLEAGGSVEISYLATEVRAMSRELARREDDRQRQLQRARQLQQHLISANGAAQGHRSAIAFHPADEVAGDFAEVITLADGSVLLCLADVSGHGIAAAMGAAMIKALLLSYGATEPNPSALLTQINARFLEASLPGDFASMIIVRIQPDQHAAAYASAGHETCYLRRRTGVVTALESTGTLLGVTSGAECDDVHLDLEHEDILVLLSDGISESMNDDGTLYGRSRIVELLAGATSQDPGHLVSHVCRDAQRFRGARRDCDDMTVLVYAIESQN